MGNIWSGPKSKYYHFEYDEELPKTTTERRNPNNPCRIETETQNLKIIGSTDSWLSSLVSRFRLQKDEKESPTTTTEPMNQNDIINIELETPNQILKESDINQRTEPKNPNNPCSIETETQKPINNESDIYRRLTEKNPNITYLSDANWPRKCMEELSEIYEKKWTDAYEYLRKKRKENTKLSAERMLVQILQEVFTICMSSTEKTTGALREAITNYVGLTKEDQDELELKDIEKRISNYRMKKLQNHFKRTEEIGSCVNICWKMCTKEPPMYLDFGDWEEHAQSSEKTATKMHFDKAKFISYTKSGDYIDYVVWPAVYLYKDGPLLKKGVAQGVQEDKKYKDEPEKPT